MKPTKNRYYCNACKRSKMLFDSEEQANNFIRYNAEEIEECGGKAPVRSYFCALCGGWHVTSNPNAEFFENYKSRSEIAVESYLEEHRDKKLAKIFARNERLNDTMKVAKEYAEQEDYRKASREYIKAFNMYAKSERKSNQATEILRKAFECGSKFVKHLLETKATDKQDISSADELLSKLIKAAGENGHNYGPDITSIREDIKKLRHPVSVIKKGAKDMEESDPLNNVDPEILKKNLNGLDKDKNKTKVIKRPEISSLEKTIQRIYGNIVANQKGEAKRLLKKAISDIQKISVLEEDKEQIKVCIDKIIEYRDLFTERFPDYPLE